MTQTVSESDGRGQQTRPDGRSPSPPTARVISVVELLADAAPDALTLAQIVRATGQSRATAHAILTEMADQGWALRHPATGAFGLGPAFVSLAGKAAHADLLGTWGRQVITDLARTLGVPCFLARRLTADTITVAEHCLPTPDSDPVDSRRWFHPGREVRLRPPICREFIAWSAPEVRETWIERAAPASRTRLRLVLDDIRTRGYSIERMSSDHLAMIDALGSLDNVSDALRIRVGDLLSELTVIDYLESELAATTPTEEVGVVTVGAPVFDAAGSVIASVVTCPNTLLTPGELGELAAATIAAAERIGAQLP